MTKIAMTMLVAILPACAQGWTPKKIVAITHYAPLAAEARIEGTVEVKCALDENGFVAKAEVLSGHPLLREQARLNALQWKFERTSARDPDNTIVLTYHYSLKGPPSAPRETGFIVDLPFSIRIIAPADQDVSNDSAAEGRIPSAMRQ